MCSGVVNYSNKLSYNMFTVMTPWMSSFREDDARDVKSRDFSRCHVWRLCTRWPNGPLFMHIHGGLSEAPIALKPAFHYTSSMFTTI